MNDEQLEFWAATCGGPAWVLTGRPGGTVLGPGDVVLAHDACGGAAIAVFPSPWLAENFAEVYLAPQGARAWPAVFETPERFGVFLQRARDAGHTHVYFDGSWPPAFVPVGDVLAWLAGRLLTG